MPTAEDIVKNALSEIGVIYAEEPVSESTLDFCFARLNRMLDSWAAQRRFVYYIKQESFPFVLSQQSYTIGPTGDFVTKRPLKIERCNLILMSGTSETHIPLAVINVDDYAIMAMPNLTSSFPSKVYYQPTFPDGTLYPWPIPADVNNKLEIFSGHQLDKFEQMDDEMFFPPGYEEAITLSLAELLCLPFGRSLEINLADNARKAREVIAGQKHTSLTQTTDVPDISSTGGGISWDPVIRGWR